MSICSRMDASCFSPLDPSSSASVRNEVISLEAIVDKGNEGIFTPFFFITSYAGDRAFVSDKTAVYVLSVMNAGGVFGRIVPAILSDKIGRFNLLIPTAFLAGLSCLTFWMFAKTPVAVLAFAVVYGFLSGAFISVIAPCVAQISDISEIGSRLGALYTMISLP